MDSFSANIGTMNFLLVGFGGFLGAMTRYAMGLLLVSNGFPWATLLVNALGCAIIAFVSLYRDLTSPQMLLFLMPGFLGGFTTFSAFGLETVKLLQAHQSQWALLNIFLNLTLGIGAILLVFYFADAP